MTSAHLRSFADDASSGNRSHHLGMNDLNMNCEEVAYYFVKYNDKNNLKISRAQLECNIHQKISDHQYLQDVNTLLHREKEWDSDMAYQQLLERLTPLIPGEEWKGRLKNRVVAV